MPLRAPTRARLQAQAAAGKSAQAIVFVNFLPADSQVFCQEGGDCLYACGTWPEEAEAAVRYAASIWSGILESDIAIEVDACWSPDLGASALAAAAAEVREVPSVLGSSLIPNTWYPQALINKRLNSDGNGGTAEMQIAFSAARSDWTYRTDAVTFPDSVDLVTIALHEMGHGLGFTGTARLDDGAGAAECAGTADTGCWGYFGGTPTSKPGIFDRFAVDAGKASLISTGTYPNPSAALGSLLTSEVFFDGGLVSMVPLYTPATWVSGQSYVHLNTPTYPSELMKHALGPGQAIHDPGLAIDILGEIGWDLTSSGPLPVELIAFEARADGDAVELTWTTASEAANAGFAVEHAFGGTSFREVGFVEGAGTTLEAQHYRHRLGGLQVGHHAFRLKQIDTDGATYHSDVVEVYVGMQAQGHALAQPFPNPARARAHVDLVVARPQQVRLEVFNALGQRVAMLHDGPVEAEASRRFAIETAAWPAGLYVIRATGETFTAARTLVHAP